MKPIYALLSLSFSVSPLFAQSPAAPATESPPAASIETAASQSTGTPPKIPLRDFFKNPVSRGYDLSPDGTQLSFLQPWESRMNIFVRPTAGGEAKRVTSEKERDIRDYTWKGNKFLVYAMDDKGDENFHLKRVDLKSGEVKDLTPFPKVRSGIIDDLADVSETDILIRLKHLTKTRSGNAALEQHGIGPFVPLENTNSRVTIEKSKSRNLVIALHVRHSNLENRRGSVSARCD